MPNRWMIADAASTTGARVRIHEDTVDEEIVVAGDLVVWPERHTASLAGRRLDLTPKEFALLTLFARNPGRVLRRDRIGRQVWAGSAPGRTIDIHVARLRAALPPGWIETVIRVGYRFSPP